jgi:hypothetical protein
MDHDQRFKELIKTFFAEFLELFFVDWANRLDAGAVEWIDKEVFPDPPEGARRVLDLVGKVPTRVVAPGVSAGEPESWLALVHIEIEAPDRVRTLRQRMQQSYGHLRSRHGLPVLPIGLYLRVGLDGVGVDVYEEKFWEFELLRFRYLYAGLPALDGLKYVEGDNWLGVALAALMKVPREQAALLGAEALRRIVESPLNEQKKYLLGECVQAYLPLDEDQEREFERLLASEPYKGARAMNLTWFDRGVLQGMEQGRLQGMEQGRLQGMEQGRLQGMEQGRLQAQRDVLRSLLAEKFGTLSRAVLEQIDAKSADELAALTRKLLTAKSLRDLGLGE